jgi:magnesium-transporting ATPase (P-type)
VVGDIVYISEKEEFPADIVLLQSSGQQGLCNIQTANLDGETNLKIKRAIPATHQLDSSPDGLDYPKFFTCTIECSTPSPGMDQNSWKGTIADMEPISGSYPLTMTQLLLRVNQSS